MYQDYNSLAQRWNDKQARFQTEAERERLTNGLAETVQYARSSDQPEEKQERSFGLSFVA